MTASIPAIHAMGFQRQCVLHVVSILCTHILLITPVWPNARLALTPMRISFAKGAAMNALYVLANQVFANYVRTLTHT